jgi:tRNA-dihydrouridine synthase
MLGSLPVPNRVLLAPLAGIGNWFIRLQAKRYGAGMAVSEMVSSHAIHYRNERTLRELLRIHPDERLAGKDGTFAPTSIQLFGQDPEIMRSAAASAVAAGADAIDINMGCPVPKVCKTGSGAALLADPARAVAVARAAIEGAAEGLAMAAADGAAEGFAGAAVEEAAGAALEGVAEAADEEAGTAAMGAAVDGVAGAAVDGAAEGPAARVHVRACARGGPSNSTLDGTPPPAGAGVGGIPITVKLRSGQRPGDTSGFDLAQRLVHDAGVAAIAFHPRSAAVHHRGVPDYELAARLVAALPVPVILTGGLRDAASVSAAFAQTGATAVMLARGALGNPWLFEQLLRGRSDEPTRREILGELDWTIARAVEHLGAERAARYLRKFYPWYVARLGLDRTQAMLLQESLQAAESLAQARRLLGDLAAAGRSAALAA